VAATGSQPDLGAHPSSNRGFSNGRAASTTSIPLPSPSGNSIIKPLGKLKMASMDNGRTIYPARRDMMEKSATADAHIDQLRLVIKQNILSFFKNEKAMQNQ
jgi:hypothetical protein